MKHVITCDKDGNAIGTCDILEAHADLGILHRAFSVFVFRDNGNELLLQKRSASKPLFSLLWTNTCCSHPQDEDLVKEAEKRLQEEMGFTCALTLGSSFVYQAKDPNSDMSENEYDTVLIGNVEGEIPINPDPNEVAEARWISIDELLVELDEKPEEFTPWFSQGLSLIFDQS